MAKRMLIDSSHPEETRVVVQSGNRLEDFDYETSSRKQLKGNIYLAKVTRVEPSLQAAFVEYGGNRHGFLPFSEIHPDYYRIPIADREALLAEEAALKSEPADELPDDGEDADGELPAHEAPEDAGAAGYQGEAPEEDGDHGDGDDEDHGDDDHGDDDDGNDGDDDGENGESETLTAAGSGENAGDPQSESAGNGAAAEHGNGAEAPAPEPVQLETEESVDTVGGDDVEEAARRRAQLLRRYKIQEVIKRRQVMLVQVTKEERGNKGAALTTYLSLPGRYCVLMPNTNKGGGISRKISNASDRRRLKGILSELEIPEGIAVIVRTAGSQRTKVEIRRDYEYLLRLWDSIRQSTLQSAAPALIYEEANLIKRAIRDLYSRDMEEVLVDGEEGYKAAKDFMKSLTPSHAKKVQFYKDSNVPLFQRHQVESQLDAMHSNTVQLRSGGYLVFNQTEALVAVDVNSGRATRERHIEETALKTNLEAAEEIGRQLRLRDLAGLIVIDFIDMEESRRNREVERRLKEALKNDRARIQLGRISPFGLLEMSRQRMRPSLFESSTELCPHCAGSGRTRTVESLALQVLRRLEEEGIRDAGGEMSVTVPTQVALYLLNKKRHHVVAVEQRYDFRISVETDDHLANDAFTIERDGVVVERKVAPSEARREERREERRDDRSDGRGNGRRDGRRAGKRDGRRDEPRDEPRDEQREADSEDGDRKRGRRGRRSRRRRDDEHDDRHQEAHRNGDARGHDDHAHSGHSHAHGHDAHGDIEEDEEDFAAEAEGEHSEGETAAAGEEQHGDRKRKRRGKRGGRRRSRRRGEEAGELREATDADGETADDADDADEAADETPGGFEEVEEAGVAEAGVAEAGAEEAGKTARRRSRGGRGRGRGGRESKPATAAEPTSGELAFGEPTLGEPTLGEPVATEATLAEAEPTPTTPEAEATFTSPEPTVPTALPDISTTDPKVVIEPATLASPATSGRSDVEQDVSTLELPHGEPPHVEPPRGKKADDDQPKRRGWWNRFV